MTDGIRLQVLGAQVDVVPAGEAIDPLTDSIRHGWRRCLVNAGEAQGTEPTPPDRIAVHLDDPADLADALEDLTHRVTRAAIASGVGRLVMLHAAALAHPTTGRTAVLVGPSGRGKTTATRELARSLGYVSDETAAIDADGALLPYPKPLSLLGPDGRRPKDTVCPDDLGLAPTPAEARLGALILLDRDPDGPQEPELEPVPLLDGLLGLAEQSSSLAALDAGLHRLADLAASVGGVRRLRYREAATLLPVVEGLLS